MKGVVLYSTQPILIAGFRAVLSNLEDFELIAACDTTAGLMEAVLTGLADVMLIEVTLDVTLEMLRQLRTMASRIPLILWVDSVGVEFASQAISLGVRGILR